MPLSQKELRIRRVEREIAGLCATISKLRKETALKVERRNVLCEYVHDNKKRVHGNR
jgi:hypothetical protein